MIIPIHYGNRCYKLFYQHGGANVVTQAMNIELEQDGTVRFHGAPPLPVTLDKELWHRRLAHVPHARLPTIKDKSVGITVDVSSKTGDRHSCPICPHASI